MTHIVNTFERARQDNIGSIVIKAAKPAKHAK